ncbi:MAG: leucine-rich repeat domain-containing protein [Aureispira sp.]|nr:leucine-rich repeat domain-containing protein [Aureispira sp.]
MSRTIETVDFDRLKNLLKNPFAINQQVALMLIKSMEETIQDYELKVLMTNSIDKIKWCIEYDLINKVKMIVLKDTWIDVRVIVKCVDTEYLYLTDNVHWSSFEGTLGNMTKLKTLSLARNRLAKFPVSILELKDLKKLYLNQNRLDRLPAGIMHMKGLKALNLSHNRFKKLPTQIIGLESLEELNLSNNRLTKLPNSIAALTNLRKLVLSNNKLQTIPLSIMRAKQLETLYLYQNPVCKNSQLLEDLQTCLPNTDIRF